MIIFYWSENRKLGNFRQKKSATKPPRQETTEHVKKAFERPTPTMAAMFMSPVQKPYLHQKGDSKRKKDMTGINPDPIPG